MDTSTLSIIQDTLYDSQDLFNATQDPFNTTQDPVDAEQETSVTSLKINRSGIIIAIVSAAVNFVTISGNLLVIYAFFTTKELRSYTNFYIVALSFSALVAGAFTMPLYSIYWTLGYWPFSPLFCDVFAFINAAFIHISIVMIATIAYDRWDALEHPIRHLGRRTLGHAMLLITVTYTIPLILWLFCHMLWPILAGGRTIAPERCYPQYVTDSFTFLLIAPFLVFWIPMLIISILYARIVNIIRRTRANSRKRQVISLADLCRMTSAADISSSTKTTDDCSPSGQDQAASSINNAYEVDSSDNPVCIPRLQETPRSFHDRVDVNIVAPGCLEKKNRSPHTFDSITDDISVGTMSCDIQPSLRPCPQQQLHNPDLVGVNIGTSGHLHGKKDIQVHHVDRRENFRATRTLTLILIAMTISSLPWSVIGPVYSTCRQCVPLTLYQVRNGGCRGVSVSVCSVLGTTSNLVI
ncbi:muscarinic acetylcholine receptor M5-like [Amphiura filiformis]|uniref:muscarinic acetylcholine receptor M5-like n=1 Tax=Amphiura filiformis TaxID=82378 RepID=UPI003B20F484